MAFRSMAHTALEAGDATAAMGEATHFSCPECLGPLWCIEEGPFGRYRCDIGHAYTAEALLADQERQLERALWLAYRTLVERQRILVKMAQDGRAKGMERAAQAFEERALEFNEHAVAVRNAMGLLGNPPNPGGDLILEDTSSPSI
jgi:two-component system chemotaxis response regulator CheB